MTAAPSMFEQFVESGAMEEFAANLEREAAALEQPSRNDPGESSDGGELMLEEEEPSSEEDIPFAPEDDPPLTRSSVRIGDSVVRVRNSLGRPSGQIKSGEETIMLYGAMTVTARDGLVVDVSGAPSSSEDASAEPDTSTPKPKATPQKRGRPPKSSQPRQPSSKRPRLSQDH